MYKAKAMTYKCDSQNFVLCLAEKVAIAPFKRVGLFNKQTELLSKCRHGNKFIMYQLNALLLKRS